MLWIIKLLLEMGKYNVNNTYALLSNVVPVLYSFIEYSIPNPEFNLIQQL